MNVNTHLHKHILLPSRGSTHSVPTRVSKANTLQKCKTNFTFPFVLPLSSQTGGVLLWTSLVPLFAVMGCSSAVKKHSHACPRDLPPVQYQLGLITKYPSWMSHLQIGLSVYPSLTIVPESSFIMNCNVSFKEKGLVMMQQVIFNRFSCTGHCVCGGGSWQEALRNKI